MRIMSDFKCKEGHVTEKLLSDVVFTIACPECGKEAHKQMAAPRSNLEPFSGDFPGAYQKWNRKHAEKLKQERKRSYSADPQ